MRKNGSGKVLLWVVLVLALAGMVALFSSLERAKDSGKVRIRYMIWGDSLETTDMFKEVVEEFERRHPDIDVEMLIVPWDAYHRKIFTMAAAQSRLDVMRLSTTYFNQLMERGVILCLDEFIEQDKDEVDLGDFYEGTLGSCMKDGHTYGLPIQAYPWGFYYNENLFNAAGLSPPDRTWTWKGKFLDAAKRLTKRRPDGTVEQYGCYIPSNRDSIMRLVIANGGNMFNEDNSRSVFNSAETREAIQFVYDLMAVHKVTPMPSQQSDLLTFVAGRVGMMPALRAQVPIFRRQLPFEWDVGPTPLWDGKPRRLLAEAGNPRAIYRYSRHPKEAWVFLKFLTGKDAARILARSGRYCMARRSAAESDDFLKTWPPEHNEYFLDDAACPNKVFRPPFPRYAALNRIFEDNFQLLLQGNLGEGEAGVATFCRVVEEQVNQLIAEEAERKRNAE